MTFRIGLTGGIGSGKSATAAIFSELGATVVDLDEISHQLTAPHGAAIPAIRHAFGAAALASDGAMDRARMRTLIFSDPAAKHTLERILHPLILSQAKASLELSETPYSVLVAPLLFESGGYQSWLDRILTVDCPESIQLARTMQRSNLDATTVRAIMASQLAREARNSLAHDVIDNRGNAADLKAQVWKFHQLYLMLAAGSD